MHYHTIGYSYTKKKKVHKAWIILHEEIQDGRFAAILTPPDNDDTSTKLLLLSANLKNFTKLFQDRDLFLLNQQVTYLTNRT